MSPKKGRAPVAVHYPSYLSCYGAELGAVASHPQFRHLAMPPAGYFFDQRPARDPKVNINSVARGMLDLSQRLTASGLSDADAGHFIKTRRPELQPHKPGHSRLEFLPTYPFTLGQVPWLVEIEDSTTLFFPYLANDRSTDAPVVGTAWHAAVRVLLQHPSCRGIITHVGSTAESLPVLFEDPDLGAKITHAPIGMRLPAQSSADRTYQAGDPVTLLFSNSWHQDPRSFYVRGGLDVVEAFMALRERGTNVRLIVRSALPDSLPERYRAALQQPDVELLDRKLSDADMDVVLDRTDIYVLPAARLHVVSVLQAMARGIATVVSDGWGMTEYVEDGVTGVIVRGRAGTTSWVDGDGVLRENYSSMHAPTPSMVQQIVAAVQHLVDDAAWRQRLGAAARTRVATHFTLDNWNKALGRAFDVALR
jgi:glycosyltransferase involved in cell wall biosynthesis